MSEDLWNGTNESAPLSEEALRQSFERLGELGEPVQVCGVTHPHVVHPKDDGWILCAWCGMPLEVFTDAQGRKRLSS